MKAKLLQPKKSNSTCVALSVFASVGGACLLIALHLKKQRQMLCSKNSQHLNFGCKIASRPISAGCQNMGQNETTPGKTNISANSSEWERGIT